MTRTFHLDREANVPAWFSSVLLGLAALAAWRCAQLATRSKVRRAWGCLAAGFAFMSCDEVASLHENLTAMLLKRTLVGDLFPWGQLTVWPLVLGPVVAVAVGWLAVNLWSDLRQHPQAARILVQGAALFFFGSAVLELTVQPLSVHASLSWWHELEIFLEETCEMAGTIVMIAGLLRYQKGA